MALQTCLSSETRSVAHFKTMYDQAAVLAKIGAWECNLRTEQLTWTDGVYDLFDLPRSSLLKRPSALELYQDDSRQQMERLRSGAIANGGGFTMDARIRTRRGEDRWMRLTAQVATREGQAVRLFGAKQDITHEKELWEKLRVLAECDPLTGLANRRAFEDRFHELGRREEADRRVAALALIDIDHFKQINDRFGHAAGDECLKQVATRLDATFGDALVIARIGGDEFAVLLRGPLLRVEITEALLRALRTLRKPVLWKTTQIDLGASIGARILGRSPGLDMSRIFIEADAALYAAKAAGRNAVRIFGDEVDAGLRLVDREAITSQRMRCG